LVSWTCVYLQSISKSRFTIYTSFNWYQDFHYTYIFQLVSKAYNVSFSIGIKSLQCTFFWYLQNFCLFSIGILNWYHMFWHVYLLGENISFMPLCWFLLFNKKEDNFFCLVIDFCLTKRGSKLFLSLFLPFCWWIDKRGRDIYGDLYMHAYFLPFMHIYVVWFMSIHWISLLFIAIHELKGSFYEA